MAYTDLIITALSALMIIINFISGVLTLANGKKFEKKDAVLKLYTSSAFSAVFVFLSLIAAASSLYFIGFTLLGIMLSAAVLSGGILMVITQCAPSGITKQALFVNGKIMEWHTVYDFYIDKRRKIVIFSGNAKGGLTLKGLTKPLRYRGEDAEKLEKYLESHISKRFNKIVIR